MKKAIVFYVLLLVGSITFAQQSTVDSLTQLLKKHDKEDTIRVNLMQELASEYLTVDSIKARSIIKQSKELANSLDYLQGITDADLLFAYWHRNTGNTDSAVRFINSAIAKAKESKNDVVLYSLLKQIGIFYRNLDQYHKTKDYFQKGYKIASKINKAEALWFIKQLTVLTYNLAQFEETLNYAKEGIALSKEVDELEYRLSFFNMLAATYKRKGAVDSALHNFIKVLSLAEKTNNQFNKLTAYNNMANIYGDRGNYPKALDYYLLTLKTAEEMENSRAMAVTYNNIAIVYYTLEDFPQTINYLKKSLAQSRSVDDKTNMANTMNNIGELYMKQDSLDMALLYYDSAYVLINQIQAIHYLNHNYIGKADIYDKLNYNDSARIYYEKSLRIAQKLDAKEEIANSYNGLARHYFKKAQYRKTSQYAEKAFQIGRELGKVETIREAAKLLHEANAQLVKIQDAYKYLKVYTEMNDSLLNADNTKEITQLEMQYKHEKELQKREAEEAIREALRQKEIARQKGIRNAFIIAFVLALFIVIQMIRSSRMKQRANKKLAYQKAEIEEKNEELQQLMNEISYQKEQIEERNNQITGSIRYAERIQNALLPVNADLKTYFDDYFVFYQPLEIVSGDFYWAEKVNHHVLLAVADCTGHGVPGAMMSMLGISYLNDIVRQPEVTRPSKALDKIRRRIKNSLHQTGDVREARDGMDLAFVAIDTRNNSLVFAGANNPLIIIRNGEMIEFLADSQPLSVYHKEEPFKDHVFELHKGDLIYLFTDGYRDQFEGATGKKYGKKRFRELLIEIHTKPLPYQKTALEKEMREHMGEKSNQIDDILVAGFKW